MKTYEITIKRGDGSAATIRTRAESIQSAKEIVFTSEQVPESAFVTWRVVPTARQIRRTQNLMRGV